MFDIDEYYPKEKSGIPYKDSNENLADYMALAWLIADVGMAWRDEADEEEGITPRGVVISADNEKSTEILKETSIEERKEPVLVPEVQSLVREALEHITSREAAVCSTTADEALDSKDMLRVRNIIEAFNLTKRMTILLVLLMAAKDDIHILEAFSYIAADKNILEEGMPTVGLLDMLLHLIFEYEVVQAEAICEANSTFMRFLADIKGEEDITLKKRLTISDAAFRYITMGENSFSLKPEASTPGTAAYYDTFLEQLSSHENSESTDFCYIKTGDTADAVHVITKLYEQAEKPLYVVDSDRLKSNDKNLFFTIQLMHHLFDTGLMVQINEIKDPQTDKNESKKSQDYGEIITSVIHAISSSLPHIGTVFMAGTFSFPIIAVHGKNTPAILSLDKPDVDMRYAMWQDLFKEHSLEPGEDIDLMDIADCHELYFGQIRTVVERCAATIKVTDKDSNVIPRSLLQETLFSLSNVDFENLATRVEAKYTWDDIYLDDSQKKNLKYACDRFRLRNRIGAQWEITKKNAYGNAVIILMYGPPGTGKTMAAQVVANEVMTPLYRVDVSQIFSKYIGETQKNIARIFEEAAKRNVVLFFDEADALFTKRTQVEDSHDKYANSDTSYLLQKVEEYNGISILATNNSQNFDPAFMRRLTYVVRFEKPDEATRKAMWHSMLSDKVPVAADVNLDWFATKFDEFSGSNIKSVIMTACFMAAADGKQLTVKHLIQAVRLEYEKIGKLVDAADFDQYAGYLID